MTSSDSTALALTGTKNWWNAKKGECHQVVLPYVRTVENFQAELFDKFCKLESTYDTNPRTNRHIASTNLATRLRPTKAIITENLIATNIDTVAANVADSDVRVRIETDGADWSHQKTAKRLEQYLEGLSKLFDVGEKCRTAFKAGAALKGTGLIKVWIDMFDQIRIANVPIDNIVVDEIECRDGHPRQLHYRDFFDREDLQAQFPEFKDQIARAQSQGNWKTWAGYRPMRSTEVIAIESWRLPIGPRGHKNYIPGRHTLIIDGCDLLDEEYHKPHYPFAVMRWNAPVWGFYGISLAERILPFQNLLNRRNYQINRSLDLKADPTTYVHQGDKDLAVRTTNQIGNIATYKVAIPVTVDHQAVGKETYDDRDNIPRRAAAETGVDQPMQSGNVPSGIESGVGVREVRKTRTQRFSLQENAFEDLWLKTLWLILDACRDLGGTKAPDIVKVTKYGRKRIKWSEVDMDDLKIEMMAASTLGDTPAGRQQRLVELAQAGVITLDESRQLMDHPDIERKLSLYNAMMEHGEYLIERIENGEYLVPSPFENLDVVLKMMHQEYLRIDVGEDNGGAPEEILEALSDFMALGAAILNPPPPPQAPATPGGVPGVPQGPVPPQPMPGMPAPQMAAAGPAFAPGSYAPMVAG